ncbi:hypothetical protein [Calothrix sp. CCY 0018]|uniref:hypothetical protein n=1 Tax=Calothrix sp. CCY 0018 TaxID=3103864 RepID=UPI0039C663CB
MIRPYHVTIASILLLTSSLFGLRISKTFSYVIPIHRSNNVEELFTNIDSIGNLAICRAEGNCDDNGKFTSLYYGHIDPSKLGGKRVLNQGFCSDYGKSKAGDIDGANRGCLHRINSRLSRLSKLFKQHNIDINQHNVAFINAVDLWNQAAPRVSDNFPKFYAANINKGLSSNDAIRKARVDAFNLSANGLFNICAREPFYINKLSAYPRHSTQWKRNCIDIDQNRRRLAIKSVLTNRGVIE